MLPSIYDIFVRFRMGKVAIVSDVQQAFLNIEIANEHKNFLRFLWFDDYMNAANRNILTLRFNRVVFGLTSSPFLLNGTIASHLAKYVTENGYDSEVALKLQEDLYVDDSTVSVNSTDEAVNFYLKAKSYLAEAGFNLGSVDN